MKQIPRRILVTGGLGYVGTALVPILAQRFPVRVYDSMLFGNSIENTPNVEFLQGDMEDYGELGNAIEGCTDIIHLAGIVTDELVDQNPVYAKRVNEIATQALCIMAKMMGIRRLVYASSSSVYGTQAIVATEESPTMPMTAYARTKLEAERICLAHASSGMTVTAIRSATCCGPSPRMRLDTIVNIFSKQAYYDHVITVYDGSQHRSNIHVKDIAHLYAMLLDAPKQKINGQIFNAVREYATAIEIASQVRNVWTFVKKQSLQINVDRTKEDKRQYCMSGEKIIRVLEWKPQFSIEQAISDNFAWFDGGGLRDPNDVLYYNTRRMGEIIKER